MKFYNLNTNDICEKLKTSSDGLSSNEALKRLNDNGKNKLDEGKKDSLLKKFLYEFNDLMIIILIFAAIISFVVAIINGESVTDGIIILAIVILNAIMGFVQELKADKAIDALKKMQVSKVKVKRDGKIVVIDSEDIVIGDIVCLEAGDKVVADCRVIWESALKVDEASLTGESVAVEKNIKEIEGNVSLSERYNMIYSGTSVVYGKCQAVVCEVGMNTEIGLIAASLHESKTEMTPLQKRINNISKFLSIIIVIIIVIMMFVGIGKGMGILQIFMLSISLAVAAIPEGLPAVITITLSLGMSTMAKKKAIVRKMASVETLGCTEIICSDKTGTITQNKMKVMELFYDNNVAMLKDENILIYSMALNNDVEKNGIDYVGDPTEVALFQYCEDIIDVSKFRIDHERVFELPFDSDRKMMSTVNKFEDSLKVFTKGSFDSIIEKCSKVFDDGKVVTLTEKRKKELKKIEEYESNKAYRILAFAYKDVANDYNKDSLENDLIFIGMTAMIDPPREDVKEAINLCKKAHIKPIMITGDSLSTAIAIGRDVGILENESEAILGSELDDKSEEEMRKIVTKYSVYARVSPMNKLSIVNAWKENNKVVAMTGDGVNDAPALKAADIGVGMGITGTEVSKGVSDIILADDSFSTIVTAVKEGRRIFDNIRNVLVYLLSSNIAEIIIVFIGMLFGIEIFLPIQILYINLITDSIPAIALSFEEATTDVMNRDVRKKEESFFTKFLIGKLCLSSILKASSVLIVYFTSVKIYDSSIATTMAFLTLVLLEMFFAYSCRNLKKNILFNTMFANKQINASILMLIIVQVLVFVTPLRNIFKIQLLTLNQLLYCILVVVIIFLLEELLKKVIVKYCKD